MRTGRWNEGEGRDCGLVGGAGRERGVELREGSGRGEEKGKSDGAEAVSGSGDRLPLWMIQKRMSAVRVARSTCRLSNLPVAVHASSAPFQLSSRAPLKRTSSTLSSAVLSTERDFSALPQMYSTAGLPLASKKTWEAPEDDSSALTPAAPRPITMPANSGGML